MKIGMNLLLWTDCPTLRQHRALLEKLKSMGFDGVEFPTQPMQESDIRGLAQCADDLGLGRSVILALDAAQADPASAEPALRQAAVDEIRRVVDQTCLIGADVLAGPLFQGLGRFSGAGPTQQEWGWAVESIRKAGEHAQQAGIRLALEVLNRFEMYMVNTVADGYRFVRNVGLDNVGLLADTHHANIEENATAPAWSAVIDRIYHVHISENNRGIPGSGHAVKPEIFQLLHHHRYTGWVTIEAFNQSVPGLISRLHLWRSYADTDDEIAREGLRFIRENIKAVEMTQTGI